MLLGIAVMLLGNFLALFAILGLAIAFYLAPIVILYGFFTVMSAYYGDNERKDTPPDDE